MKNVMYAMTVVAVMALGMLSGCGKEDAKPASTGTGSGDTNKAVMDAAKAAGDATTKAAEDTAKAAEDSAKTAEDAAKDATAK
ncbi:MAG: hypothetical protein GC159_11165 [Phycisphaera sp.]|nr:hypothetical protein [Phycisphaera sp.]